MIGVVFTFLKSVKETRLFSFLSLWMLNAVLKLVLRALLIGRIALRIGIMRLRDRACKLACLLGKSDGRKPISSVKRNL